MWRSKRPPGLPPTARTASPWGGAESLLRSLADKRELPGFTEAVVKLAKNESGCTFALPANRFDVVDFDKRDDDISAWGCFQYNSAAWRRATRRTQKFPWLATPEEELEYPLKEYEVLYREVLESGGTPEYAEKAIRLWHRAPAYVAKYMRLGKRVGFDKAWKAGWVIPGDHEQAIDRKL